MELHWRLHGQPMLLNHYLAYISACSIETFSSFINCEGNTFEMDCVQVQITLCIFQVDDLNVEISTLQERLRASLVNRTRVNFLGKKVHLQRWRYSLIFQMLFAVFKENIKTLVERRWIVTLSSCSLKPGRIHWKIRWITILKENERSWNRSVGQAFELCTKPVLLKPGFLTFVWHVTIAWVSSKF